MGNLEFSPHGVKSVIVSFTCGKCGNKIKCDEIILPSPNLEAEKSSDSHGENIGWTDCPECEENYDVGVYAGWADGYINIEGVDGDTITIETIDDEDYYDYLESFHLDSIIEGSNFIIQFKKEIENLKKLNKIDLPDGNLQETLQRQIYSGAITCLEDYLSTKLIELVLNDDDIFKKFVKSFKNFKNRKFDLSDIYDKIDSIKKIVKKEILDIIYHDLPKVRGIYQDTLGISFPEIKDVMKIIINRHDMVHRNGKNKEGEKIEISEDSVFEAIDLVESFVNEIEDELDKINDIERESENERVN